MRFSLELPTTQVAAADQFVTVEAVTEVTRAAAAAGFDAVNVTDHPAPDARWLDAGGHHAMDPFTVLGVAAAADPGIRLHTHVYVAGYRNPFLGAKAVHTLDVLSGGRVILGVAAGYLKPEFAALGADFTGRGARLDDALAVLDAVYTGADVARDGDGYSARGVRLRPVRPARPPVWVGGNSAPARRRAARHDGWAPFHTAGYAAATRTEPIEALDDLARAIAEVRAAAAGHGDPDRPFDVCWSEALLSADDVPRRPPAGPPRRPRGHRRHLGRGHPHRPHPRRPPRPGRRLRPRRDQRGPLTRSPPRRADPHAHPAATQPDKNIFLSGRVSPGFLSVRAAFPNA